MALASCWMGRQRSLINIGPWSEVFRDRELGEGAQVQCRCGWGFRVGADVWRSGPVTCEDGMGAVIVSGCW